MKSHKLIFAIALASLILLGASAHAATKAELKARFQERYPKLLQYKNQGKIGESYTGLIEAVNEKALEDANLRTLIGAENADRSELYRIIAGETNATPEAVARENAARKFQRARSGDWLKYPDGQWRQKA